MPSWKKVITSGSDASLNSLNVTSGVTGSLFGTASYASNGGVTQLLAGPNITLSPTNGLGQITVSSTSGGGGFNTATGSYGSFYDTTTQTNPVGNIPRSMSLDTTDITNGVSVSGSTNPFNTYIKTENAGVYKIQFSAQVEKTDSGTDEVVIWLRKNGTDLTDTATTITLNGNNDKQVAAWNWFVNSAANDYYQIIWYSADTDLRLLAEAAGGGHPGIPSVIVTANRVDQFLSNTGSFSGSFTGNLIGTASYATQALSASYVATAQTASYALQSVSSSFATTASYVSSNFQYEIHVSQIDGNDTTGNGDLLKPVATIGKALLIVSASVASTDRRTIIVHPGTYIENITVNTTNTYFFSTGLLGANCLISGSVTISAATRMSGLKMTNLIVSSSAPVYLNNCAVDNQMTVSGSGYLEVQNTSLQCTSGIQVVGPASSGVIFENCSLYPLTVNNASAAVYIISCNQAITPTLTAGALTITRSTISSLTSGATSTALTTAAGSVLVLESCNVYNSLLTSHAAITANGFYSIKNVIYNKPASTLASLSGTGGPLATISQFQYINADNITTSGLTVTGSLNITGSTTQIGNINLTGSLNVAGSVINNLTASYAISASQAVSASYAPSTPPFPYTGSAEITGSLTISGSLRGQVSALSISGNTASVNLSTNNFFTLTLADGTGTNISPTNINPGQTVNILVTQGTAGTGTVTFPSLVKQPSGSAYTGTALANAIDIVTMIAFDSTNVYVSSVRNMI